ncbi:MAG TPA: hypothetical protein VFJ85_16530 [Acidimicrobiales bacterium]|nr:hypothetical protein [Acidimicrobiales bacterium]
MRADRRGPVTARRLRRAALGAAMLAPLAGATSPAAAHTCALPSNVKLGKVTEVGVRVGAETSPVVAVDIHVPDGFRLDRPVALAGWQAERHGSTVTYRSTDDRILPFGCSQFQLAGKATARGTLVFTVVAHADDGSELRYDSADPKDENAAQLVYARRSGGGGLGSVAVWAVPALLVAGGVAVAAGRRRPAPPKGE